LLAIPKPGYPVVIGRGELGIAEDSRIKEAARLAMEFFHLFEVVIVPRLARARRLIVSEAQRNGRRRECKPSHERLAAVIWQFVQRLELLCEFFPLFSPRIVHKKPATVACVLLQWSQGAMPLEEGPKRDRLVQPG
jgi:hypothetical protein